MNSEKNPWTLITFSKHKGDAWIEKFLGRHGIAAEVIGIQQHAKEPKSACGPKVGMGKFTSFTHDECAMDHLRQLQIDRRVAIMDVNGVLKGKNGERPEVITTTRGEVTAVDMITQLSKQLLTNTDDDEGRMIFMNICGYGQYSNEKLKGMGVLLESSRMSISGPLLRIMAEPENWPNITKLTEAHFKGEEHRQLLNPLSTGGIDSSMVIFMAHALKEKDGFVKWEDSSGRVWRADGSGIDTGMYENMTTHLRGFPSRFIDYLAGLPD